MVDWKNLSQKVKDLVQQRGGQKSAQQNPQGASQEDASTSTQGEDTGAAVQDPGAPQQGQAGGAGQ